MIAPLWRLGSRRLTTALLLSVAGTAAGCEEEPVGLESIPDRVVIGTDPASGDIFVDEIITVTVAAVGLPGLSLADVRLDSPLPGGLELVSENATLGDLSRVFRFRGLERGSYPLTFAYVDGTPTSFVTIEVKAPPVRATAERKVLLEGGTTSFDAYLAGTNGCPIPGGAEHIEAEAGITLEVTPTIVDAEATDGCEAAEDGMIRLEIRSNAAEPGTHALTLSDPRFGRSIEVAVRVYGEPTAPDFDGVEMLVTLTPTGTTCGGEIDPTPIDFTVGGLVTEDDEEDEFRVVYSDGYQLLARTPNPGDLDVTTDGLEDLGHLLAGLYGREIWAAATAFATNETETEAHIRASGTATAEYFMKEGDDFVPFCEDSADLELETDGVGGADPAAPVVSTTAPEAFETRLAATLWRTRTSHR